MEPYAVSNHRFAAFAAATGYVTEAERDGWSFVFAGRLPDDFPMQPVDFVFGRSSSGWTHDLSPVVWRNRSRTVMARSAGTVEYLRLPAAST